MHNYLRVAAVIENENKFLMILDKKHDFWKFPGGKVMVGESIFDALKREVKEEIGIEINPLKLLGMGEFLSKDEKNDRKVFFFSAKKTAGTPKPDMTEVEKVSEFSIDEMSSKQIDPATNNFLKTLLK